ncbi:MAG: threonylcarbamoyl-AMP synthase, partial [bacterium]|nr:threonylcarbamoyl-AMP synthase [bacterium]
ETVYGLGADALNPIAVSKIFEAKNRPYFNPLIVHIASHSEIERLVSGFSKKAQALAERFWPGPLTLVLPKSDIVPDLVTAGLQTVAIRMPAHETALKLISLSQTAIAAPSANPFGYISPTRAQHVHDQLGDRVDMILDGGECTVGIESTIIRPGERSVVLRYGGISLEEIEETIGKVEIAEAVEENPASPGRLPSHYSPRTRLEIVKDIDDQNIEMEKAGLLAFKPPTRELPFRRIEILSSKGSLREAAANFFSCLHKLDAAGVEIIYAEEVPQDGLGRAIMDRLYKAAQRDRFS